MNIISKLHILKDTAVFTSEKLSQKFWCDLFHALERTIITSEDEKKSHPLKTSLPNIGEKYMPPELT